MKLSNSQKISTALTAAIALVSVGPANAESALEKCYGVAKKGNNDCGNSVHSCAGQSTVDSDPAEWIYLPTGICERLTGGKTK